MRRLARPYLGYVHLMDAHSPYLPPRPYDSIVSEPGRPSAASWISAILSLIGVEADFDLDGVDVSGA